MASSGERVLGSGCKMLVFLVCWAMLATSSAAGDALFSYSEPSHVHRRQAGSPPLPVAPLTSTSAPPAPSSTAIPWGDFSEFPDNKTLSSHDILSTMEDHHKYYNSSYVVDGKVTGDVWVNMEARKDVQVNNMLSDSHRRAATVKLSFEFPFYGHYVRNVTVATGGFLYTGDYVHAWLTATQYIAPLMANFDTSLSNNSYIKYVDNGTAFTVQWEKVHLKDRPEKGEFTFQATLHRTGDIVFVYQQIPVKIEDIDDEAHPVKIGVSDAYIVDKNIFFVRKKTIYEYHRVHFAKNDIQNNTVIFLMALPTCSMLKDCDSCTGRKINFECQWCPTAERCSDGVDRNRQDWLAKECHISNVTASNQCSPTERHITPSHPANVETPVHAPATSNRDDGDQASGGYLAVAFACLLAVLVLTFLVWATYAYFNPHSPSGQFLIRYRPNQWQWRRGEARYMAATIHM